MSLEFKQICKVLRNNDFYYVAHPVVKHHLLKDFEDYNVTNARFYIKKVGTDYLHVAVIESLTPQKTKVSQVRYTCAADDLLYGLRIKFTSGGSNDPQLDIVSVGILANAEMLSNEDRYIRPRFRHGRVKAKTRALFVYLIDSWKSFRNR